MGMGVGWSFYGLNIRFLLIPEIIYPFAASYFDDVNVGNLFCVLDDLKHIFLSRFLDKYNGHRRAYVASCWKVSRHLNDRIDRTV